MSSTLDQLRQLLATEFDIDPESVQVDANLFDDLDIDSIDAIDMLSRLRELSGKDIPAESLKDVRTIADVLALLD